MQTSNGHVALKRIKQISVKNLFGMFDHVIPLHLDERVTIIHGPNGFGKTITLRLLKALFQGSSNVLKKIPFDEFRVEFEDGTSLWISKAYQTLLSSLETIDHEGPPVVPVITFYTNGESPFQLSPITSLSPSQLSVIDRRIPGLERIEAERWLYIPTSEILTLEMILERFGDTLPLHIDYEKQPEWLVKIRKSVAIHFIETQRLLDTRRSRGRINYSTPQLIMVPTVQMYTEEIAATIKAKLAGYSDLSQSLDKTFPARVFNPKPEHSNVTFDELRARLAAINEKREKLSIIGLLDDDSSSGPAFQIEDEVDESKKIMLAVYVEDTEKKLGIFDDLAAKIGLLTRIINKRFLYKQMTVDKDKGFVFTTAKGTELPLENLSSGEQHELVLFYQLLFQVDTGSLVLIDEPELSLHVVWQEYFLQDLQEVTKLVNVDALIATHSPDIIHDRRDLIVELVGPE